MFYFYSILTFVDVTSLVFLVFCNNNKLFCGDLGETGTSVERRCCTVNHFVPVIKSESPALCDVLGQRQADEFGCWKLGTTLHTTT